MVLDCKGSKIILELTSAFVMCNFTSYSKLQAVTSAFVMRAFYKQSHYTKNYFIYICVVLIVTHYKYAPEQQNR